MNKHELQKHMQVGSIVYYYMFKSNKVIERTIKKITPCHWQSNERQTIDKFCRYCIGEVYFDDNIDHEQGDEDNSGCFHYGDSNEKYNDGYLIMGILTDLITEDEFKV